MKFNKFIPAIIVLIAGTLVLPSCKKGEDDPFLSLRSRKSRVAGTWEVKEVVINGIKQTPFGTVTYVFEKDGTLEIKSKVGSLPETTNKMKWSFLSKSDDFKNKERLIMLDEDQERGEVFELKQLKNKEMVWYQESVAFGATTKSETKLEAK